MLTEEKEYLTRLNAEQRKAATTIEGRLFILAGAGSGKTATLVARVAYMLDNGIEPENILLLTFTNKAAKEMKARICKMIGDRGEKITASTFHSFCANFLRKHAPVIGCRNDYLVLDDPDAAQAMEMAKQEYLDSEKKSGKEKPKDFPKASAIRRVYEISVNSCAPAEKVICDLKLSQYEDEIKSIINRFRKYKKDHNFMDYDDLLYYTERALATNEALRLKTDEKYKYISCDEYQDTNTIQNNILELMSQKFPNLAVVGDDNQSIYAFRCANIGNILNFESVHPDSKTVVLEQNYRSSQELLDLSNKMMEYAKEGKKKTLHGQFNGNKPKLVITESAAEEADYITSFIKKYPGSLTDIAVLCRGSTQSYALEQKLNSAAIPFDKYGGKKFLEKAAVKDILSFLKLSVNYNDEISLFRLLQLYPGIGKTYAKKIAEIIAEKGFESAVFAYPKRIFSQYLSEFSVTATKLRKLDLTAQLSYLIDDYYEKVILRSIDNAKIDDENREEMREEYYRNKEDLEILKVMAEKYKRTDKFLEDLTLDAVVDKSTDDKLVISTFHSVKGLEYKVVFVMDCIEGITPRCSESDDEDKEELRCMYVALTRAKAELHIMVPLYNEYRSTKGVLTHFLDKNDVIDTCEVTSQKKLAVARHCNFDFDW